MRTITTIFILMTLASCGVKKKNVLNIAPEAQKYVTAFQQLHGQEINDLEVFMRPIEGAVVGYCQRGTNITPRVVLNTNYWNGSNFTVADKEVLVFHELGHCLLKRGHNNQKIDSVPYSIMNAHHIGAWNYTNGYNNYVTELFGKNSFAGITFDGGKYASTMIDYPEFVDSEIEVLTEAEINDCVNDSHGEEEHNHDEDEVGAGE